MTAAELSEASGATVEDNPYDIGYWSRLVGLPRVTIGWSQAQREHTRGWDRAAYEVFSGETEVIPVREVVVYAPTPDGYAWLEGEAFEPFGMEHAPRLPGGPARAVRVNVIVDGAVVPIGVVDPICVLPRCAGVDTRDDRATEIKQRLGQW